MQLVKLTTHGNGDLTSRMTPGRKGVWDGFRFHINDTLSECDWWVVYDGLAQAETISCPVGRTIFITGEPPAIKTYDKKFLSQFNFILTSQPGITGPNVIHGQTALPWTLYSQNKEGTIDLSASKDYDWLRNASPEKTKLLSAVTSNKRQTEGHRDRLAFIERLQDHFKDRFDVFGPGQGKYPDATDPVKFKYHENKWDALAPYKYHMAIENSVCLDYWTEKITDAYLAGCHPIYFGCPNITEYFPADSLTVIDIAKPEEAIQLIEKAIAGNAFEKSAEARKKAKELILEKYQIFPLLTRTFGEHQSAPLEKSAVTLYPESYFKNKRLKNRIISLTRKIKKLIISKP